MMTEKNQALLEETLQKSGVEADHTQLVLGMGGAGIRLAEELAEAMRTLTENKDLREKYGQAGARRARECFRIEDMQNSVLRLYENLASE